MGNTMRPETIAKLTQNERMQRMMVPSPKQCIAASKTKWRDKEKGLRARCENAPMPGQNVCRWHGGKAPNAIQMAEERQQLRAAVKTLRRLGEHVEPWDRKDPRDALLDVVHESYIVKEALKYLVQDLEEKEVEGMGKMIQVDTPDGPITVPHSGGAMAITRIRLYNEALDRAAKLSKMAMDVGIEERMVKLAEGQAVEIAEIIKASISELPQELQLQVITKAAHELKFRTARQALPAVSPAIATSEVNGSSE